MNDLAKLRVSLARVAQAAGVSLAPVGLADDAQYGAIAAMAETRERGWNALAGAIADAAGNIKRCNELNCESVRDLEAVQRKLVASLRETLRALETHLDDDTNAHGLKSRDILCPCNQNEVARAKAVLAEVDA